MEHGITAVLLDIEGTTTPISFVHEVLFPFARERLDAYTDPATASRMRALMDADSKDGALKELQGRIWETGYADGTLRSTVYPDVPRAFARWRDHGCSIAIYSSGSVRAQQLLFAHSDQGDLTTLIGHYFDTAVGAKKEIASYRRIAVALGTDAQNVLFLSDVVGELDAAGAAGMHTGLTIRPGNAPVPATAHARVQSFDEIT
jgi:enolase-phosphatase E1